jgi:uncharacterized protein (DUF3084 family)
MEYRYALGRIERFPDLVAELVRLQVDILLIGSGPATMAAKHITQAIPMTSPQHSSSAASPGMVGGAGEADTALPNWSRRRQFGQGDSGLASLMVCC